MCEAGSGGSGRGRHGGAAPAPVHAGTPAARGVWSGARGVVAAEEGGTDPGDRGQERSEVTLKPRPGYRSTRSTMEVSEDRCVI